MIAEILGMIVGIFLIAYSGASGTVLNGVLLKEEKNRGIGYTLLSISLQRSTVTGFDPGFDIKAISDQFSRKFSLSARENYNRL
jgi:hypothetical protein